jgi:hypothetical protein
MPQPWARPPLRVCDGCLLHAGGLCHTLAQAGRAPASAVRCRTRFITNGPGHYIVTTHLPLVGEGLVTRGGVFLSKASCFPVNILLGTIIGPTLLGSSAAWVICSESGGGESGLRITPPVTFSNVRTPRPPLVLRRASWAPGLPGLVPAGFRWQRARTRGERSVVATDLAYQLHCLQLLIIPRSLGLLSLDKNARARSGDYLAIIGSGSDTGQDYRIESGIGAANRANLRIVSNCPDSFHTWRLGRTPSLLANSPFTVPRPTNLTDGPA